MIIYLRLSFHPKKVNVFPISLGVDFLGYRIFKDYRLIRKSTVKRFVRIVKRKIRAYDSELICFDKLMESFNSWEAYMSHGDSYRLKESICRNYFKNIM